jgi:hypothetical protein
MQGIGSWGLQGPQRSYLYYRLWQQGQGLRYAPHFHGEDGHVHWDEVRQQSCPGMDKRQEDCPTRASLFAGNPC